MILAQNRQQLLNGSKFLFLFFVLSFFLTSCDALRSAQKDDRTSSTKNRKNKDKEQDELDEIKGQVRYNPDTGEYETVTDVTEEVDTVRWNTNQPNDFPPIKDVSTTKDPKIDNNPTDPNSTTNPESQKLYSYKVAMMLPFLANQSTSTSINPRAKKAINMYAGAKMAFDILESEGIKLQVSVLDTRGSKDQVKNLVQREELKDVNMIFGPLSKSNLKIVSSFAKTNKIPLVSPSNPSSTIGSKNPFYVQFNPRLVSHCEAITKHAKAKHEIEQIVLLCRNDRSEISRLKYFQNANYEIEGSTSVPKFKEYIIDENVSSGDDEEVEEYMAMDFTEYFAKDGKTTVFILPSWASETFIYEVLRNIRLARGDNKVVIYGMPQWQSYERISYDYYENLNVHLSTTSFLNTDDRKIKAFRQDYFNRYGTTPSPEAFVGFDMMLYCGRMLHKHGTQFQLSLDQEHDEYLHTNFQFEQLLNKAAVTNEDFSKIDFYENKFVNIIEFKDYHFQVAD